MFGSVVLMCHDRHLIKVYLRDICIRCGVDIFRWYHDEDYEFGRRGLGRGDIFSDILDGGDEGVV